MTSLFFALGAIAAFLAVAAGAFGAHGLQGRVSPEQIEIFQLGAQYQMYHALALLAVAWASTRWPAATTNGAGWAFVVGIVVFSGTLYAMGMGGPRWLGAITPVGGTAFLVGWALLAWSALKG